MGRCLQWHESERKLPRDAASSDEVSRIAISQLMKDQHFRWEASVGSLLNWTHTVVGIMGLKANLT